MLCDKYNIIYRYRLLSHVRVLRRYTQCLVSHARLLRTYLRVEDDVPSQHIDERLATRSLMNIDSIAIIRHSWDSGATTRQLSPGGGRSRSP